MAYQVANGAAVTIRHACRDIAGALVTGQAGALVEVLSDPAAGASGISVSINEVGSSGWYLLTWTPNTVGVWVLSVTNPAPLVADGATTDYAVDVLAGAVAGAAALTSLARLKRRIGKDETDSDVLLNEIISEVSADIELRCGRVFAETTYTEYTDGDNTRRLVLRQGPLVSVTSVNLVAYGDDGAGARTETLTVINPSAYVERNRRTQNLDGPAVLERLGSHWPAGIQNIKTVFLAGYSLLPERLVGLVTSACAAEWFTREAAGLRDKTEGDYSVDVLTPAQIDQARQRVADPYRYDWGVS